MRARNRLLLSILPMALLTPALGEEAPACSIAALKLDDDPDFKASAVRNLPTGSHRALSCKAVSQQTLGVDSVRLRFHLADILNDGQFPLDVKVVLVERLDGDRARVIASLVLPPDPLDGAARFEPQLVRQDGAVLIRLAPRHSRVYRLEDEKLVAVAAFDWRDKLRLDAEASQSGQALGLDLEKMEGRVALTPDKRTGAAPPSAFSRPKIALARLAFREDRLTVVAEQAIERREGEYDFIDQVMTEEEEERALIKNLPAGVEPCSFSAWSRDADPKGLNVRAEPSAKSRILGVAPPPRKAKSEEGAFGLDPIASEFKVIGFREGWFLVEDIKAPGVPYGIAYPKSLPQAYKGRGWVASGLIGAAPANRGMPVGRLYRAPYVEARFDELRDKNNNAYGFDYPVAAVIACSGSWALIETKDGQRGWTRSLCSNQATNCS